MAVTKLEIESEQTFAGGQPFGSVGPYRQLDGTVQFAVDPTQAANSVITNSQLAPRDSRGLVEFSADFRILQPVELHRGNHRLLFDILNRGRGPALRNLNSAPDWLLTSLCIRGNGFLMRQGYTVAWGGWQHDAPDVPGVLRLHTPEAVTPEGPISGRVVITFQPNSLTWSETLSNRFHRPYPASDLQEQSAVLTEQNHEDAPERIIPREQWSFARWEENKSSSRRQQCVLFLRFPSR